MRTEKSWIIEHGRASLEKVVESGEFGLEILHPGGLEITRELAKLCHVRAGAYLLDVASGTGESACYLAKVFGCRVFGVDASVPLVDRARKKAEDRRLEVEFKTADAHDLPFLDNTFDVVISECTMCALDKDKAIAEMVRVVKPGGHVGIHDICWRGNVSEDLRSKLGELENERPETLVGWKRMFERAGLERVTIRDKPNLMPLAMKEMKKQLGFAGQLKIALRVLTNWGVGGLWRVFQSERIFRSEYLGYGIIVGRKA